MRKLFDTTGTGNAVARASPVAPIPTAAFAEPELPRFLIAGVRIDAVQASLAIAGQEERWTICVQLTSTSEQALQQLRLVLTPARSEQSASPLLSRLVTRTSSVKRVPVGQTICLAVELLASPLPTQLPQINLAVGLAWDSAEVRHFYRAARSGMMRCTVLTAHDLVCLLPTVPRNANHRRSAAAALGVCRPTRPAAAAKRFRFWRLQVGTAAQLVSHL